MDNLHRKYVTYTNLVEQVACHYGFIEHKHCDSLCFTGLLGCVPEMVVDIDAAFDKDTGMWHRRPIDCPCWPKHSKSTISRDMLVGLAWYAFHNKRLDISEQVITYALSHWLKMGKGTGLEGWSRIIITPGLLATFSWISYKLGGPSRAWLRWVPVSFGTKVMTGFQAHLQVLHILLRKQVSGKESDNDRYILREQAKRSSQNALFQYAAGNTTRARALLTNDKWWPEKRLPTVGDRREPWLFQRDYGEDWQPAVGAKKHSGGDFLFLYWLICKQVEV